MTTTKQTLLDVSLDSNTSGASWGSIFAGAAAAAALSLVLMILGVGLGFSAISPWSHEGISATALGISSVLWLSFTHISASSLGGYLAGRLRIRWASVHSDEVYFRDTAHGLLAWAIASLVTAALLGSVVGNIVSMGVSATATSAANSNGQASVATASGISAVANGLGGHSDDRLGYWVDSLFRVDGVPAVTILPDNNLVSQEAGRILASGLVANSLPIEDQHYLAQMVTRQTGLGFADAEKRVTDVFEKAHTESINAQQQAKLLAEKARNRAAYSALWTVIALLLGAFMASYAATYGGKQRDGVILVEDAAYSQV